MKILSKKAVTLVEIMMAVAFMALSIMPIIGVFASSFKVTERDKDNIVAMKLCQAKLDESLALPFEAFEGNMGPSMHFNNDVGTFPTSVGDSPNVNCVNFSDVEIDGVLYHFDLQVTDRVGTFTLITRKNDATFDETMDPDFLNDPVNYVFDNDIKEIGYKDLVHRYKMTVTWEMKGHNSGSSSNYRDQHRSYSLITFKAKLADSL